MLAMGKLIPLTKPRGCRETPDASWAGAVRASPLPFLGLAGPPLAGNCSWAWPQGGGSSLRLGVASAPFWGHLATAQPPSGPRFGSSFSLPRQSSVGGEGRRKLAPTAQRSPAPKPRKKPVTHRLVAVSLDHTINDAPICGLGLQPHLDREDRAGGQAGHPAQLIPRPL